MNLRGAASYDILDIPHHPFSPLDQLFDSMKMTRLPLCDTVAATIASVFTHLVGLTIYSGALAAAHLLVSGG